MLPRLLPRPLPKRRGRVRPDAAHRGRPWACLRRRRTHGGEPFRVRRRFASDRIGGVSLDQEVLSRPGCRGRAHGRRAGCVGPDAPDGRRPRWGHRQHRRRGALAAALAAPSSPPLAPAPPSPLAPSSAAPSRPAPSPAAALQRRTGPCPAGPALARSGAPCRGRPPDAAAGLSARPSRPVARDDSRRGPRPRYLLGILRDRRGCIIEGEA